MQVSIKMVIFTLLFFSHFIISAQVLIEEESGVTTMMERFELLNKENTTVKAWKIQIVATTDRRKMESIITQFSNLYPGMEYEWKHNAPYYQVYTGAFEKKEDFQAFLLELKREFPSSIPVIDQIEKIKLI